MITKKCQSIIFYYTILYYYIWVEILFLYKNHKKTQKITINLQLLKHPKNVQFSFSQKSFGKSFHKTIKKIMVRKI